MAKKYKVKLLRKEKLAKDTWLFAFEKPEGYTFIPGQYQTFTLELPNGKTDWRDMTITSSPHHHELWLVTKIQKKPSLFKKILLDLSLGSFIQVEGPSGGFTVREQTKPHVFLAGGIGVTVFHSMLQNAAENDLDVPMKLLASFSKKEDIVYYEELKKLENKNRKIIYTLTQDNWEGEAGRITEELVKKYISDMQKPIFMIAGGQAFVDAMQELLVHLGVPADHIRIDYFTGY